MFQVDYRLCPAVTTDCFLPVPLFVLLLGYMKYRKVAMTIIYMSPWRREIIKWAVIVCTSNTIR